MAGWLRQRRLLPGILAIFVVVGLLASGRPDADAQTTEAPYGPLITAALKYEGQRGGQCYMFMQKVVKEVTGRLVSGDYRQSYIDAGAAEVPLAQAQSGDIIQLANDKNTHAAASYPGLHTALIMDVLGDGKFKVIDSNWLFDGVVRVHDDYSPLESAGRYAGISVHVWRVPPGRITPAATPKATPPAGSLGARAAAALGTTTATTTATAIATTTASDEPPEVRLEPLEPTTMAVIAADGDCLRLREEPGLSSTQVACPPTGATVRVLDGSEEVDGYRWQLVQSGTVVAWAADMYLEPAGNLVHAAAVADGAVAVAPAPVVPQIVSGTAPPVAGGYALFVFSGGSYEDLLTVSGCRAGTATFWATAGDGQLMWYIPAVTVAAVNAAWESLFAGAIPDGTALMGRCV